MAPTSEPPDQDIIWIDKYKVITATTYIYEHPEQKSLDWSNNNEYFEGYIVLLFLFYYTYYNVATDGLWQTNSYFSYTVDANTFVIISLPIHNHAPLAYSGESHSSLTSLDWKRKSKNN